jgi:hypothetical protein
LFDVEEEGKVAIVGGHIQVSDDKVLKGGDFLCGEVEDMEIG